jgi:hypothetical protein
MSDTSSMTSVLARALNANSRYTALLTQLASTALDSVFSTAEEIGPQLVTSTRSAAVAVKETVLSTQSQAKSEVSRQPAMATILLEGEAGSKAFGFFVVENKLQHEISTRVEVGPLVAQDGRQIKSKMRFEPGSITLAVGQQVVARVTVEITRDMVAGERYQGEIVVPGVAGARIPIVIRRKLASTVATKKVGRAKAADVIEPVTSRVTPKKKSTLAARHSTKT